MPRIMADHNVEGHLEILLDILSAPEWKGLWHDAECDIETFTRLGLDADAPDDVLWRRCQQDDVVLITGIGTRRRKTPSRRQSGEKGS